MAEWSEVLNRYIKNILKELSETVPSLRRMAPTQLTMKQKEAMAREGRVPEYDRNGNIIVPRWQCVTTHTARRSGIINMYLSHKYTMLQMMHVSGHKTEKTFRDYIKLSSDEIAHGIDAIANNRALKLRNYLISTFRAAGEAVVVHRLPVLFPITP